MVTTDEIEREGLTTDEVMDREFVQPRTEVEWVPEWDEHSKEQPGENTRIEGDTLIWERDGFTAHLGSHEVTHWRATVEIPERVGRHYPREIDLKCRPRSEHGFIEDVESDGYTAVGATLILQANFQPVYEVNQFIDELLESAEQSEAFRDEVEEKMAAARKNED